MKKKFLSMFSIACLLSPSVMGTVQVYADTEEMKPKSEEQESSTEPLETESEDQEPSDEEGAETADQVPEESIVPEGIERSESVNNETTTTSESEDRNASVEGTSETITGVSENIASGTFGTSEWYITDEGVLHIGAGEFSVVNSNRNPWSTYRENIIKIVFDGLVTANVNSSCLFNMLSNVTQIEGLNKLDTSNVTSMNYLFGNMTSLKSLDISTFDTSNVTNMVAMFSNIKGLTVLDLSNFDTSNVTSMSEMFYGLALTSLDVSNFDTSNVTTMSSMFNNMNVLTELDVSNFDTSRVTNMGDMFSGLNYVTELDLSNFDTSQVTNMGGMFTYMFRLVELDLSNFDTIQVTNMDRMFSYSGEPSMSQLRQVKLGPAFRFMADAAFPQARSSILFTGKWMNVGTGTTIAPRGENIWTATELMENYNGLLDADTYVWEPVLKDSNVSVLFVDREGNQLAEPSILNGKAGLPYDSEPKEIPGWYVVETPNNASGTFTEEAQEVVYVYERSDGAPVTVKYKDSEGNQLAEPSILSGKVGLPYDSEPKEIPGWYVVETPNNASGIFSEDPQEVVYMYRQVKKETIEAKDSILYVGDRWQASDNYISATDQSGQALSFNKNMVSGTVDTTNVGVYPITYTNGTATKTITVTVKEKETPAVPVTPVTPDSSDPVIPDQGKSGGTVSSEAWANTSFPKTGEEMKKTILFTSIAFIVMGSLLYIIDKNRRLH